MSCPICSHKELSVSDALHIGRREGVLITLCVETLLAAIVIAVVPEGRGKVQEAFSDGRRRAQDATFRFRNRGNHVPDGDVQTPSGQIPVE